MGAVAEQFGTNLRSLRLGRQSDLSQEQLARLANLHRSEVSKLERGMYDPLLTTIVKLGSVLDVRIDELLNRIEWRDGAFYVDGARIALPAD